MYCTANHIPIYDLSTNGNVFAPFDYVYDFFVLYMKLALVT